AITRLPNYPITIWLARSRCVCFPFGVRIEDQLANPALPGSVYDGTQQREAATLAVHVVLPRRKRDVPASAAAASLLPDRKADQLESFEGALRKMQLGVGELSRRVAPVVWRNLDRHGDSLSATAIAVLTSVRPLS